MDAQVVDLGSVVNPYLEVILSSLGVILCSVLIALAKKAVTWFNAKTGLEVELTDEMFNIKLHKTVEKGVLYAMEKSKEADWTKVKTKNVMIANASKYVAEIAPDALARFGYTPEALEKIIVARLGKYTVENTPVVAPSATEE